LFKPPVKDRKGAPGPARGEARRQISGGSVGRNCERKLRQGGRRLAGENKVSGREVVTRVAFQVAFAFAGTEKLPGGIDVKRNGVNVSGCSADLKAAGAEGLADGSNKGAARTFRAFFPGAGELLFRAGDFDKRHKTGPPKM
jgi:hypothetical protein